MSNRLAQLRRLADLEEEDPPAALELARKLRTTLGEYPAEIALLMGASEPQDRWKYFTRVPIDVYESMADQTETPPSECTPEQLDGVHVPRKIALSGADKGHGIMAYSLANIDGKPVAVEARWYKKDRSSKARSLSTSVVRNCGLSLQAIDLATNEPLQVFCSTSHYDPAAIAAHSGRPLDFKEQLFEGSQQYTYLTANAIALRLSRQADESAQFEEWRPPADGTYLHHMKGGKGFERILGSLQLCQDMRLLVEHDLRTILAVKEDDDLGKLKRLENVNPYS